MTLVLQWAPPALGRAFHWNSISTAPVPANPSLLEPTRATLVIC